MISETGAAVPLVDVEPEPTTVDDIFHDNNQYQTASLLSAEIEEGNTEYKYKLTELNEEQFMHRVTQLNWRLNEGNDVAIYEIGVEDDGNPLGTATGMKIFSNTLLLMYIAVNGRYHSRRDERVHRQFEKDGKGRRMQFENT